MDLSLTALLTERAWLDELARTLVRGHAHEADDLAQDTWVAALQRAVTLSAPRAWLATVARNRARQRARTETRRQRRELQRAGEATAAEATDAVVARFELQRQVATAVDELDEPYRTTVLLHQFEGLTLAEIGRRQRVPEGTVRWRLHRAHALLRTRLQTTLGPDWRRALLPLCGFGRRSAGVAAGGAALVLLGVGSGLLWLRTERAGGDRPPAGAGSDTTAPPAATSAEAPRRERIGEPTASQTSAPGAHPTDAAHAAPADQQGILRLRLLDDEGRGVDGTVTVVAADVDGRAAPRPLIDRLVPPARADADGTVSILVRAPGAVVARQGGDRELAPGTMWRLRLRGEAAGHVACVRDVFVADGEDRDLGSWTLPRACTLRGEVVDAAGAPRSKVEVGLVRPPLPTDPDRAGLFRSGHVGAAHRLGRSEGGRFVLRDLPVGPALLLAAGEDGRGFAWVRLAPGDNDVGKVVLEPLPAPVATDHRLRVRVEDAVGTRLVGARVFQSGGGRSTLAFTGRDGVATLHIETAATETEVTAVTSDLRLGHLASIALDPDAEATEAGPEVVLRVDDAPTVLLRVRDEAGQPIDRATALVRLGNGILVPCGARRPDGTLAVPVLPMAGAVVVEADDYARATTPTFARGAWPAECELRLRRAYALHGVVRADGRPIVDARVRLCAIGAPGLRDGFRSRLGGSTRFARTDAAGTFRFTPDDANPDTDFVLLVDADGAAPAAVALGPLDPSVAHPPVAVDLEAGVTVGGQVRRADGTPVPRAVVALQHDLVGARTAVADLEGRFSFPHVMPGDYELRPTEQPLAPESHAFLPLAKAAIAEATWTNLTVQRADVTRAVVVDLCTVDGQIVDPHADFRGFTAELVLPHDDRPVGQAAELTADGRFTLTTFAPGRHLLRLRSPGGAFGDLELTRALEIVPGHRPVTGTIAMGAWRRPTPRVPAAGAFELRCERDGWTCRTRLHPDGDVLAAPLTPCGEAWLCVVRGDASETLRVEQVPSGR